MKKKVRKPRHLYYWEVSETGLSGYPKRKIYPGNPLKHLYAYTTSEARKLAAWLIKAADYLEAKERK
jgi:hypothetical protein